jgi:hypothetical protein
MAEASYSSFFGLGNVLLNVWELRKQSASDLKRPPQPGVPVTKCGLF